MPPYWPWVQAVQSYVRDLEPEQLRSDMGAGAAAIAEVVSDVREQLPAWMLRPSLSRSRLDSRLFRLHYYFLEKRRPAQALGAGARRPALGRPSFIALA